MARTKPETPESQAAASERATERGEKQRAAWAAAEKKLLAKVSRFQKQREVIEISTDGNTLIVTKGTIGKTLKTKRTRFGEPKTLSRAVKHARADAILLRYKKVRSFK